MGPGWGAVPLRVVVGIVFAVHGAQKLFSLGFGGTAGYVARLGVPLPTVAAAVVIVVELLGGIALLVGVGTRVVALVLALHSLAAILAVHLRGGFFVPSGIEFVLTLFGACLALVGMGAGPWSVDGARSGENGGTTSS